MVRRYNLVRMARVKGMASENNSAPLQGLRFLPSPPAILVQMKCGREICVCIFHASGDPPRPAPPVLVVEW